MELEISSLLENDGNVKKAEAYTKELEDVSKLPINFFAIKSLHALEM